MPVSDEHPVLAAILAGVQDLQRSSVTRDQLKHFVELQRAEIHTLVCAETEPLHSAVEQIHANIGSLARDSNEVADRIKVLEQKVASMQSSGPSSHRGKGADDSFQN